MNVLANFVQGTDLNAGSSQALTFFSPNEGNAVYGGQITYRPQNLQWVNANGSLGQIVFTFVDQLYRPLQILDPTGLTVSLRIRGAHESM